MKTSNRPGNGRVSAQNDTTRLRAYGLWEKDGKQDGKTLEYWLKAESQEQNSNRQTLHSDNTNRSSSRRPGQR